MTNQSENDPIRKKIKVKPKIRVREKKRKLPIKVKEKTQDPDEAEFMSQADDLRARMARKDPRFETETRMKPTAAQLEFFKNARIRDPS